MTQVSQREVFKKNLVSLKGEQKLQKAAKVESLSDDSDSGVGGSTSGHTQQIDSEQKKSSYKNLTIKAVCFGSYNL